MRRTMLAAVALGLFFLPRAPADDAARAVIDRAIQASGGAEGLAKYKAAHWKGKGKFYGLGEGIDYVGEWFQQLPDLMKALIDVDFGGQKIQNYRVVNGAKGWSSMMGAVQELDKEQLAEAHEALHYDRVVHLVTLKDPAYTLTALGESVVEKQPAVGVKVSHKGRRDIQLYFDKESGRLIKGAMKVKDQMTGGQEVDQEVLYSNHKEISGRLVPMKAVINREGKLYIEAEITEYKRLEKLDDKVFTKP